ncbi:hypothetical protein X735_15370 [Mesorhizobium sp. L2C085B000]|nr:hypothetical protein X735_15370 [Mesorhizobium sp. L2C085B000]
MRTDPSSKQILDLARETDFARAPRQEAVNFGRYGGAFLSFDVL